MTEASKEMVRTGVYSTLALNDRQRYAAALIDAEDLVPESLWTKNTPDGKGGINRAHPSAGKVFMVMETADMLGIHPMAGIQGIHIIEGKPSLSANLLAALVRKAGHKLRVQTSGSGDTLTATATLIRSDDPDYPFVTTWSHTDAKKADLLGKTNWKKYERAMLKSRARIEPVLIEHASAYRTWEPRYVVNLAAWLNQKRWEDDTPETRGGTQAAPRDTPRTFAQMSDDNMRRLTEKYRQEEEANAQVGRIRTAPLRALGARRGDEGQ